MSFHKFNQFTGRVTESKSFQPFFPISPNRVPSTEPNIIFDTIKTKPLGTNVIARKMGSVPPKMIATMKKYQANMHTPVFLINGTPDKILFGITVVGTIFSLFQSARFVHWVLTKDRQ